MGAPDLLAELPFVWRPPATGGGAVSLESSGAPSGALFTQYGIEGNSALQQPFVYERLFTAEQSGRIRDLGMQLRTFRGLSSSDDPDYRKCTTSFLEEGEETAFIFERLRKLAASLAKRYRFRLSAFAEPLHFITYDEGSRFGWHSDLGEGDASTRKISISIQLSESADYTGGDLDFCPHGEVLEFRGIGNALAFPAYIPHRVSPLTSGRRHALVAWIHGPAFT